MTVKVSDYIVEFLVQNKINKVFGYVGGTITHLYDSLDKNEMIEIVNTIHEQGAGFAAEGYARVRGDTGVAIATSGPGATNLITAIGSCFFDSIPTIFITGQVSTKEYKYSKSIRQLGFQEIDIVNIVMPIVKYAVFIDNIHNLRYELEKACFLSREGRKGPVLVDIPSNIQFQKFNPTEEKSFYGSQEHKSFLIEKDIHDYISKSLDLVHNSKRPIILIGGGARVSKTGEILRKLLDRIAIPVVYSLMGKGVVADSYKYNLGLIGAFGSRCGNMALSNADLVLVLGSRLDGRQTGNIATFIKNATVIQVDIDRYELGAKISADLLVNTDVESFVRKLNNQSISINIGTWLAKVLNLKSSYPLTCGLDQKEIIPNKIMSKISKYLKTDDVICVDVGQHQMWAAQSLDIKGTQKILFSGGMGAMGFALPAAIGAVMASGGRSIVIVGDGGFQMNIQELEVVKRRGLSVKIFIFNNANLGMVRQQQEQYNYKNYIGTEKDYSVPDFKNIGNAYGIESHEASDINKIFDLIEKSLKNNKCEIINIKLTKDKNRLEPKLFPGRPLEDMFPYIDRQQLKAHMAIKPLNQQ
jgi:acetolactate synthase-1/2/3 large subunit